MTPDSFTHFLKRLFPKMPVFSTFLLLICSFGLTACNVDPRFGYAFAGTGAVMAIALVIATVVTKRSGKKKRSDES